MIEKFSEVSPKQILLIKVTVYDTLCKSFSKPGLPVVYGRLHFQSSVRQLSFHEGFENIVDDGRLSITL